MPKLPKEEKLEFTDKELKAQQKERDDRKAQIDADIATRTSRYDQDLKERARAVGINPDNFAEEHVLGEAVAKAEEQIKQETEQV